jgi:NTE family protein
MTYNDNSSAHNRIIDHARTTLYGEIEPWVTSAIPLDHQGSTMTNQTADPSVNTHEDIVSEENRGQPEEGIGLCLSGGGYRAMLFHTGALLRLNELGLLKKLNRVASVSGGSITAGVLALNWKRLQFDAAGRASNLRDLLVVPVQNLADQTIDRGSILSGVLLPGSVSDRIIAHYREILFGKATLQDLPDDSEGPRFIITATNVQSGVLVRMSRPYLADYRVGLIRHPKISLAAAVAASSAFPPVLSPAEIDVDPKDFVKDARCDLQKEPYTDTMVLSDGGVYDNLGMEPVWKRYKTILVSDGGGQMQPEPEPAGDWARHSMRILEIVDNQVRSLRKRHLIQSYIDKDRSGTYWGIRTNIANYQVTEPLPAPHNATLELANTATRLKRLPEDRQQLLMNWGYAVCDAAIRKHAASLIANGSPKAAYPFPAHPG